MEEKIILDSLTQTRVSIKRQKYVVVEGVSYPIEQSLSKGYYNSKQGREEIEKEVNEPYKSAILTVWGDSPTVEENIEI